jgi:hypothetical protein
VRRSRPDANAGQCGAGTVLTATLSE